MSQPLNGSSRFWESLLCFYSIKFPDHPAKRRMVLNVSHLFRKTWNIPRIAQRRGLTFELNLNDSVPRSIFYLGYYERWETRWLERALQPGWTVLDVGAHIGYYSLLCAKSAGPKGAVYAFEPNPSTFARLRRNLDLNPNIKIDPQEVAFADCLSTLHLMNADNSNTGTSYVTRGGGNSVGTSISVVTLDEFIQKRKLTRIDFIKIDVEGYEMKVLAGAEQALAHFRPRLMIELNPDALTRFGAKPDDLPGILRERGYSLYEATWRGLRGFKQLPPSGKYINLIALPK